MFFIDNNYSFFNLFDFLNFSSECSKKVFWPIFTYGLGILEPNLLLSPAANKIKQKLIMSIYPIFM